MSAPLNGTAHASYHAAKDDEEEYYEEWVLSSAAKKWLIAGGVVAGAACIYVFCFLLPQMFIPELRALEGIVKVDELAVQLRPVDSAVVAQWDLQPENIEDVNEEFEEIEEIEDNEEYEGEESVEKVSKKPRKDRLIMVGDIHGLYKELRKLLKKVKYNPKRDELLALGDFIAKGPDSLKVTEYLAKVGASCVLGNHEYYAMNNYAQFHGLDSPSFVANTTVSRSPDMGLFGFNEDPEYLLAKKLQPNHIEYINLCSVIKKLGRVPLHSAKNTGTKRYASGIAVHAGLRWDLTADLNEQDPVDCMEMRLYVGPHYNETTDDPKAPGAVLWSKIWNSKHKTGAVADDYVVYYGHDAHRGVNLKRWAKGLDNGCSRGDYLAAMVVWHEQAKGKVLYKEQVVRVHC